MTSKEMHVCHSNGGKCNDFTEFEPALDTFQEIEAFLSANPYEIVTIILEDYVHAPNGLTNVLNASGLLNYWFPVLKMQQNGQDWPLVSDIVASNQCLLVFTSISSKHMDWRVPGTDFLNGKLLCGCQDIWHTWF